MEVLRLEIDSLNVSRQNIHYALTNINITSKKPTGILKKFLLSEDIVATGDKHKDYFKRVKKAINDLLIKLDGFNDYSIRLSIPYKDLGYDLVYTIKTIEHRTVAIVSRNKINSVVQEDINILFYNRNTSDKLSLSEVNELFGSVDVLYNVICQYHASLSNTRIKKEMLLYDLVECKTLLYRPGLPCLEDIANVNKVISEVGLILSLDYLTDKYRQVIYDNIKQVLSYIDLNLKDVCYLLVNNQLFIYIVDSLDAANFDIYILGENELLRGIKDV